MDSLSLSPGELSAPPLDSQPPVTPMSPTWVDVLVDCPGAQGLYTYEVPPHLSIQPGDIVLVPFGSQQVGGVAIAQLTVLPEDRDLTHLRLVEDVISQRFFPSTYWDLLQQVAEYYCTPLIQVIRAALPPGLLGRSQRRIRLKRDRVPTDLPACLHPTAYQLLERLQAQKQGEYSWHYLQRQIPGAQRGLRELLERDWVESYLEPPTTVRPKLRQTVSLAIAPADVTLSPRQQEILEVLKRRGSEMAVQELLQTCHVSSSVLKGLEQKGCLVIHQREVLRGDDSPMPAPDCPQSLTSAQAHALYTILGLKGFAPVLLHGVTGSGKTEVYLQAIAPVLQAGKSALVLVPEIGLTPQLTDRFRARFGSNVQVYHSALSEGERYDTWRQMLSGAPQVVIGTRSAIFAPLRYLGLIVLDEEHDSSFKQDQPIPCYHARTVAYWRATLEQCPLILGSATPSLESWQAAQPSACVTPPLHYLSLPDRIHCRPLPPIQVVDMRQEFQEGNRSMFSRPLAAALHQLKSQGLQGLLFIHRRGHSTFVSCRSCGYVLTCTHCDISLTYHQPHEGGSEFLRCHYCGYGRSHPSHCPDCGSPYLKHFGSGTQRVVQELNRQFPDLRCLRFDSDTTRTKGAHRILLNRFAQGEADVLVGTQMLTKGIDLPQVTLVGVVAADGLLHLADFRASERAFQMLTQVAGRAGRGTEPGQVILQTYSPHHPVIQAVQQYDCASFLANEQHQRLTLRYPPYTRLILLRLSSPNAQLVRQTAERLAEQLRPPDPEEGGYELLGPAPAAVVKVANRYRWQILLKFLADCPVSLPNLTVLRNQCPASVHLTIDVDPLHLL